MTKTDTTQTPTDYPAIFAAMTERELNEFLYETGSFYEVEAQYLGEIALYGDAWPGAAIQVAEGRAQIAAADAEYARRFPPVVRPADVDTDSEPF